MRHFMPRSPAQPPQPGTLAANVRRWRQKRALSQTGLAHKAGLSRSTIAAIELGKYKSTDVSSLAAIARALDLKQSTLMDIALERGEPEPFLQAFRESRWFDAVSPTDDEMEWIRAAPEILFHGIEPTAEAIASAILWRRQHKPNT